MTDIPQDVMQAAREAAVKLPRYIINYDERGEQQHDNGDFVHLSDALDYLARAILADREKRVRVKPLEWHELLRSGPREGFVCSVGGVLSYSIMLGRNRVYGIRGEHDGAAEFRSLEEAMTAAQADYERRILAALEFTDAPLEDDPDALTVVYMAGEAKAKERLAAAEADAERLAEALRDVDKLLAKWNLWWGRGPLQGALAAHENRKGDKR